MRVLWGIVLAAPVLVVGCSSAQFVVAPEPPKQYESIGPAEGSACGVLLFDFIPIRTNSRSERAYREALTRSHGTALIDTRIRERWYFIGAGELLCTDIEATAIR